MSLWVLSLPLATYSAGKKDNPKKIVKKALNNVYDDLKKGKNLQKHETTLLALLNDSANRGFVDIYLSIHTAQSKQYDAINQSMYLKQKVDTSSLFSLCRRMFVNLEQLDSVESLLNKKGESSHKYRKSSALTLDRLRPNLYNGGIYYLNKDKYEDAFAFFDTYIDCASRPLFDSFDYNKSDKQLPSAAYWACYCGYKQRNPDWVLKYYDIAQRDTSYRDFLYQYVANAYYLKKDTENSLKILEQGFDQYPLFPYFFKRLIQYYSSVNDIQNELRITEKALEADPDNELFLYTKGAIQLSLGNNTEALHICDSIIARNDTFPETYFVAGTACLNIASQYEQKKRSRTNMKNKNAFYKKAMNYMERYRTLAPEEQKKWAPALYRVYYNLNMGKELSEVEKLINK